MSIETNTTLKEKFLISSNSFPIKAKMVRTTMEIANEINEIPLKKCGS
jgi:hypothetical protein